jgi:hypothetical protein
MEEALHRLSKKPSVKGWIMLDRSSGGILKTSGQIASIRPPKAANNAPQPTPNGASFTADVAADPNIETQAAQELGSMVWAFLSTAGSLVQEMDTEVWLLRNGNLGDHHEQRLMDILFAGRAEAATTTNEETGTRHRARTKVHTRCYP